LESAGAKRGSKFYGGESGIRTRPPIENKQLADFSIGRNGMNGSNGKALAQISTKSIGALQLERLES
jgi:hypothetical protein